MKTVFIVIINDLSDFLVQTKIDSVWGFWQDAAERVEKLNIGFQSHDEDFHSFYIEEVVN